MKVKSKETIYVSKNARTITMMPGTKGIIPTSIDDRIISLDLGNHVIYLGDVIKVKEKPYKINSITKSIVGKRLIYNLSNAGLTKSSMFILPMLGGTRRLFMYDSLFVNCFIGTEKHKNKIVLLYRFSGDALFLKFEKALKQFRGFIDCYDPSPYFVSFVFKVPEQHKEDYVHFLNGRYSELSHDYKDKLLDFHDFDIDGELAQILYKAPKRRLRLENTLDINLNDNSELYSILNEKDETFDPKVYI